MATTKLSDKPLVNTLGNNDTVVIVLSGGANRRITVTNLRTVIGLPAVSAADNGKVAKVVNGAWAAVEEPDVSQIGM